MSSAKKYEKHEKRDYRQEQTDEIIKMLEKGTAPWQRPFKCGEVQERPYNFVSNRPYRGMNALMTISSRYNDPRWMTYKQAQDKGMNVKRGEHGLVIEFWKWDKEGTVIEDGKEITVRTELDKPIVMYSTIFNGSQIEGMPEYAHKTREDAGLVSTVDAAEEIINKSNARIIYDTLDRAFYRPSTDEIHSARKENYRDTESYYSTILHEMAHWTGHPERLNRENIATIIKTGIRTPETEYAKEELRAEIASYFMGIDIGLPMTQEHKENHAAYIGSWLESLKKDKHEIYRAAKDAEAICAYLTKDLKLDLTAENDFKPVRKYMEAEVSFADYVKSKGHTMQELARDYDIANFIGHVLTSTTKAQKSKSKEPLRKIALTQQLNEDYKSDVANGTIKSITKTRSLNMSLECDKAYVRREIKKAEKLGDTRTAANWKCFYDGTESVQSDEIKHCKRR